MAYLVIAVGLLMSLAGGYLLNYGYAIVQVERGWSSVIAGSVFLTGGLVTMSLGLLLRTIVRALVGAGRGLTAEPVAGRGIAASHTPIADFDARRATGEAFASEAVIEPSINAPFIAGPAEPSFAARGPDLYALGLADGAASHGIPLSARDLEGQDRGDPRAVPAPMEHDAPHTIDPRAAEAAGAPLDHADAPMRGSLREAEPDAPAMDDWLDRAFSEIDGASQPHADPRNAVARDGSMFGAADPDVPTFQHGMRLTEAEPAQAEPGHAEPSRAEPSRAELLHTEPAHFEPDYAEPAYEASPIPEPPHRELADAEATTPVAAALPVPSPVEATSAVTAPASPPAPHDSAVIGRYESDDTSYVMYADGSIEAQSPAGVYRFSSMAELKAFIEG